MRLAANTFALQLGDRTFDLKPSLRAAFVLWERYDGFHNIARFLGEGSVTTANDIIGATTTDMNAWAAYVRTDGNAAVRAMLAAHDQLQEFVLLLAGIDSNGTDKPQTGKPIPFDEWFTTLFEIGTGWLSWPPETVWDATPAEILAAQRGRVAMLKAIFGGKDDQSADVTDNSFADLKADLNAIGDLTNHVRPR